MTACDFKPWHACTWRESERFIVTTKDAGMEMKMRGAMIMMTRKNRLISPAFDGERCPYLNKLDKGIAPDPLPRIPPFLPERSFSTRATFPVRAASSSSWSLPMVGNQAAPTGELHPEPLRPPPSTERSPLPRPCLRAEHSRDSCSPFQTSRSSSRREEESHLLLVSLDHFWVECGRRGEGERERGRTRPIKNLPPLPCTHGLGREDRAGGAGSLGPYGRTGQRG